MANTKISELPAASAPVGVDVVPLVQGGVTKRSTLGALPVSVAVQSALDAEAAARVAADDALDGRLDSVESSSGGGVILPWVTATDYVAGQGVTNGGHTYLAANDHTSGATFAGDLAAYWTPLPVAVADVVGAAPSASPALTGNPTAPTPEPGDNNTSISTTAFVSAAVTAHVAATDPHGDRAYADALIAANDALIYKGAIDASANPNYPAASAGHVYKISIAGKIGGGAGVNVEIGDSILCTVDGTSAGTQAAVGGNWSIIQGNLDGAVIGPASATSGDLAVFSGTSGRLIAGSGTSPSSDDLLQRKAGAWTNRTPAQVKADLALAKGDVGLGNVDNTSDAGKPVSTATLAAIGARPWVTGTAYIANQIVTSGGVPYRAVDAHTAGATFAADVLAHWLPLRGATKRVTMPISAPPDYQSGGGLTDVMLRWALRLPVDSVRWRLRIRNKGNSGALTMTDVYQGLPSFNSTGAWVTGNFTATPTNIYALASDTFPSDGSEFTSGWITAPGSQFSADVVKGLSFGFTLSSGTSVVQGPGYGGSLVFLGAGAAASAAAATAVGASSFATSRLDVRLEVEFVGDNRVVLVIGDSVTAGVVDIGTIGGAQPAVVGPNALWPAIAGMRDRFMWINASVSGKDYSDFTAASVYLTRLDLATTVPDEVILACGINTLNVSSVATEITNLLACIDVMKTLGIKRIKLCTVIPQTRWKPGRLTAFAAIGASTFLSTASYANAEAIDIGYGLNAETVTASGASAGTKPPFTTTITGTLTKDHGVGETTGLATESKRKLYNATIQLGLRDVEQIIDFAKALSDGSGVHGCPNPDYYGALPGNFTHPNMASWAAMADALSIAS